MFECRVAVALSVHMCSRTFVHRPHHRRHMMHARMFLHRPSNSPRSLIDCAVQSRLILLNRHRLQTLGVLDIDSLHEAEQLLLGTLLVITLSRDTHTQSVWHTLNTLLPDLLIELWIEADVPGTL